MAAKVKTRILVLDDEVDFSQLLKLSLEQTGDFEVRVANTPLEGLATAAEFEPNLVLLDVMLPEMDGGEVAARLQADPKLSGVPIIFLTAAVRRAEVSSRNGRIGGLPFLAKPVDLPELIACMNDHLQKASAARKPAAPVDSRAAPRRGVKKPDGTRLPSASSGLPRR